MTLRATAARLVLALTALTAQVATVAGFVETFVAAAGGGNRVLNNGRVFVDVTNGGGGAISVTIVAQNRCSQGFLHDQVTSVPAGATYRFGTFDTTRFNDAAGYVWILYSGVTTVTVAAVQF